MSKKYVVFQGESWSDENENSDSYERVVCIYDTEELAKSHLVVWRNRELAKPSCVNMEAEWEERVNKMYVNYEDTYMSDAYWCRYEEFEILHELKPE